MKKAALHPGWVLSINDGDRHWIGPHRLATLHGLRMADCVVWDARGSRGRHPEDYDHYYPERRFEDYGKPAPTPRDRR